jgi:DNA polymerase III alpha subunit (gram-positive type)
MKEIFIDTETVGLDPQLNGIWQIAGMIVSKEQFLPFNFKMAPHKGDIIEPEALEMSRMTEEEMWNLGDPFKVHHEFTTLMSTIVNKYDKKDKFIFYGYNARFDSNFLREWFAKCGDKYFGSWFWTPPVDIMATAAFHLAKERPAMANFKLETVVKWLGLKLDEEGDFHDADIDIKYTYLLAEYLRKRHPFVPVMWSKKHEEQEL